MRRSLSFTLVRLTVICILCKLYFPLPGHHESLDLLAQKSHNPFSSPQKLSFIPKRVFWRSLGAPAPPLILERDHSSFTLLLLKRTDFSCSSIWLLFFFSLSLFLSVVPGQDVSLRNLIFFKRNSISHAAASCSPAFTEPLLCPRKLKD